MKVKKLVRLLSEKDSLIKTKDSSISENDLKLKQLSLLRCFKKQKTQTQHLKRIIDIWAENTKNDMM